MYKMPAHTDTLRGLSFQKNVIPGAVTVTAASALGFGQYGTMLAGVSPVLREVAMGAEWQEAATNWNGDKAVAAMTNYLTAQVILGGGLFPFGLSVPVAM